ncbi:MAG: 50S ribosomal protein L24 [Cardiobacteriaceae bacterium]|nr:50S ribosomal protein L24 [Cardiobacteriaceae bacterium]
MKRIRKNDEVIVIAGKSENKGKRGKVKDVFDNYVVIEGVNLISKHMKPNRQQQTEGSIIRKEAPIHISNVMLFNSVTGKGDRVSFKNEDGKKIRVYRSNGNKID